MPKKRLNSTPRKKETTGEKVQCFGRKKTAVAVALVRTGSGQVRVNGCPIHTVKPDILRVKVAGTQKSAQTWRCIVCSSSFQIVHLFSNLEFLICSLLKTLGLGGAW